MEKFITYLLANIILFTILYGIAYCFYFIFLLNKKLIARDASNDIIGKLTILSFAIFLNYAFIIILTFKVGIGIILFSIFSIIDFYLIHIICLGIATIIGIIEVILLWNEAETYQNNMSYLNFNHDPTGFKRRHKNFISNLSRLPRFKR